jgi:phosphotriesterase-related protein
MAKKQVMTVLGPIDPDQLGLTSMHEHVTFQGAVLAKRLRQNIPQSQLDLLPVREDDKVTLQNVGVLLDNSIMAWDALIQDDEEVMVGECVDFKNSGGDSILEVSVPGIQLDTGMIKRISERSGVNIIVSTGFYTWDSWPEHLRGLEIADYRKHMMNEYENGVQGTDCKPGCVKIAVQDLNQMEENALRACAQVVNETNLPLTIHPCYKIGGERTRIVSILKEEGMDLSRLVFAHTTVEERPTSFRDLVSHPELYKVNTTMARALLDMGITLSFEFGNFLGFEMSGQCRFGYQGRLAGVYELIRDGYCRQMVLGCDVCGRTMLRRYGGMGYLRLTTFTIPTLRDVAGVSDYAIRQMVYENPKRMLSV